MKGYKFYLEYDNQKDCKAATRENLGNHLGTVIAVLDDTRVISQHADKTTYIQVDAIGAFQNIPNCACCFTTASADYLSKQCKRISEAQAREIHPKLFNYLEN